MHDANVWYSTDWLSACPAHNVCYAAGLPSYGVHTLSWLCFPVQLMDSAWTQLVLEDFNIQYICIYTYYCIYIILITSDMQCPLMNIFYVGQFAWVYICQLSYLNVWQVSDSCTCFLDMRDLVSVADLCSPSTSRHVSASFSIEHHLQSLFTVKSWVAREVHAKRCL